MIKNGHLSAQEIAIYRRDIPSDHLDTLALLFGVSGTLKLPIGRQL
jgi:hypothetical protein